MSERIKSVHIDIVNRTPYPDIVALSDSKALQEDGVFQVHITLVKQGQQLSLTHPIKQSTEPDDDPPKPKVA